MRVVTIQNKKGGVGKTTFLLHLAHRAVELKLRTLVIDLDTQANASTGLTHDYGLLKVPGGSAAIFTVERPEDLPIRTVRPLLDLLHGHTRLDEVDSLFDVSYLKNRFLPKQVPLLRSLPYDLILFDTAPSAGPRQIAPLFLANRVLIPIIADEFAVSGLAQTRDDVEAARTINPAIQTTVLVNMFRANSRSQRQALFQLQTITAIPLRQPFFPLRDHVPAAISTGVPVWAFKTAKPPLRALWRNFATETLGWQ
ncbi:MAG TPA: ParA family protein [Thermoanaerobaculia bacterium]|nr:ParA family protein [Thermoanaerobaculia bacterium]